MRRIGIALHHERRAQHDLARLAGRHVLARPRRPAGSRFRSLGRPQDSSRSGEAPTWSSLPRRRSRSALRSGRNIGRRPGPTGRARARAPAAASARRHRGWSRPTRNPPRSIARHLEQHLQHGRHQVERGRPPALDRLDIGARIEAGQDRRRPAAQPVRQDEGAAGVNHRGGVEHDVAGPGVDQVGQHIVDHGAHSSPGVCWAALSVPVVPEVKIVEHDVVGLDREPRIGIRRLLGEASRSGPTAPSPRP